MMKKAKHYYSIGDTVVLTLSASSIITEEFGNSVVKISDLEDDKHFGPCYRFEGISGYWPETAIAYCRQGARV